VQALNQVWLKDSLTAKNMVWKLKDDSSVFAAHGFTLSVTAGDRTRIRLESDAESKSANHALCDWQVVPRDSTLVGEAAYVVPGERYVRQQDMITSFPQKYPWNFSYQLDVRVLSCCDERMVVELWLSIQTSMLESNPELWIVQAVNATNPESKGSIASTSGAWQCHPEYVCSSDKRSIMVVHPMDRADARTETSPSGEFKHLELFGRFMEKGVIRRGRLLLVGARTTLSEKQVQQCLHEFSQSSLPLTA
jgi:hypothetical protein